MLKLDKRIELLSNIAIIVVCVLLVFTLAKRYSDPEPGAAAAAARKSRSGEQDLVGKKVSLPDVDWAGNGRTLVLALQTGCHFCTDSAPFYKELVKRQAGRQGLQLVAVLPQPVEQGKGYLNTLGVSIDNVRQSPLNNLGVVGTPTLLLVDNNGSVVNAWRGRLDSNREREVLERLQ
ncbi:MAG TPA: hypothetical protein VF736_09370 [Pyrinomonadaceae bacterium]